jgi:hypothetical protein
LDRVHGVAADATNLAAFERAEQLGLRSQRQFANLVEKQRAAIGSLEQPRTSLVRAGEGAAHVAK